jgi:hypothetical protein
VGWKHRTKTDHHFSECLTRSYPVNADLQPRLARNVLRLKHRSCNGRGGRGRGRVLFAPAAGTGELDPYDDETCLDYLLFDQSPGFDFTDRPGEYNGIVAYGDEVWTCFTGTSQHELDQHPDHNPSVIWSSLILLP